MLRDRLQRSFAPRAVVALSRLRVPRPWALTVRVELYFAFDDPYAVLGLPGLLELTRERGLELEMFPLVDRGIPGDPAADKRRAYSIVHAHRLVAREGCRLERKEPPHPSQRPFLPAWPDLA